MSKADRKQHTPVFVSSTREDLKEYRRAIQDALTGLEIIDKGMEYLGSESSSQLEASLEVLRSCSLYIGVFTKRYGVIPDGYDKSVTHLEYEEAQKNQLPSLIYLIDDEKQLAFARNVESEERAAKLESLKAQLKRDHSVRFFTTPEDLAAKLRRDLAEVLHELNPRFRSNRIVSSEVGTNAPIRVFISYAAADKRVAKFIESSLRTAGLSVWFDEWQLEPGDSIEQRIEQRIQASDYLLVLLSPDSVSSKWVQLEWSAALSRNLSARAATIVPAIVAKCKIPPILAAYQHLDLCTDLQHGVERLIQQIRSVTNIDFSQLNPKAFEELVVDLLLELGFVVERHVLSRDSGFDFLATIAVRDPFGSQRRESWLVEVKFYRDQRVSVNSLQQMLGYLLTVPQWRKGLVVTNGQLTSVAIKFMEDNAPKLGQELRVIDGAELRAVLLQHPLIVDRHFKRKSER